MNYRKLARKADKFRRKVQDVATLGASEEFGRRVLGNRLNSRTLLRRVVGGRNLGALGFKRPKVVTPAEKNDGLPGTATGGESNCISVDPADGSVRKPYSLIGRIQLAAAAQAIDTDLGDFLDAANIDDVSTDNEIPFGVTIERAQLFVGLNEIIASPINNPAMMAGFYIRFLVNGIEEARWPLAKFNPVFSNNGYVLTTSGAAAAAVIAPVKYEPVPFRIFFDPDKKYSLALYTTKAVTPAAVTDLTLVMEGHR